MIEDFRHIRLDGKIITENMLLSGLLKYGFEPCIVVAIQWIFCGNLVEKKFPYGVISEVLRSREKVICIAKDEKGLTSLLILSADGNVEKTLPNRIYLNGVIYDGFYEWFSDSRSDNDRVFGVIFQTTECTQFWLDVDANTGSIVEASYYK